MAQDQDASGLMVTRTPSAQGRTPHDASLASSKQPTSAVVHSVCMREPAGHAVSTVMRISSSVLDPSVKKAVGVVLKVTGRNQIITRPHNHGSLVGDQIDKILRRLDQRFAAPIRTFDDCV